MTERAIEATGLAKSFGETKALAGVDLAVRRGSVLAVLGPNGAGKPNIGKRHFFARPDLTRRRAGPLPPGASCSFPSCNFMASAIPRPGRRPARHPPAARLRDGSMPCDQRWPTDQVEVIARWTESGTSP
jgi:hypothetical protein